MHMPAGPVSRTPYWTIHEPSDIIPAEIVSIPDILVRFAIANNNAITKTIAEIINSIADIADLPAITPDII